MSVDGLLRLSYQNPRAEHRGKWLFPVADLVLDRFNDGSRVPLDSVPYILKAAVWPSRSGKALDRTIRAATKAIAAHFGRHAVRLDPSDLASFLGREMLLKADEVSEAALPEPGKAALRYARQYGWAVFAVYEPGADGTCSCGDPNCANIGKHPRTNRGLRDATTDRATIIPWWWMYPDANIGVGLGKRSGIVAIDVDPRHAGDMTLADLETQHGPLPETVEAVTGGGGRHILFTCPDAGCATRYLGPGLELRGDGSYIVVAPSVHKSGRRYEWEAAHHPDDVPLAVLPAWVLVVAKADPGGGGNAGPKLDPAEVLAGVPEGQRDTTLFRYACRLRAKGLVREEAEALVLKAARVCQPPFPDADALAKVEGAWKYPSERAEIEAGISEARDYLASLAERTREDPGAAFEAEILRALLLVRDHDAPTWARVRKQLRDAGVRLRDLDRAMKQAEASRQEEPAGEDGAGPESASAANGRTTLPMILANRRQLRDVTGDALAAVVAANEPPAVFERGTTWVRLRRGERGTPAIDTMNDDAVRGYLARVADWFEEQGKGDKAELVPTFPPVAVVNDLLALPDLQLPALTAVVGTPVFAPDGGLVATEGYHASAGLYVNFPAGFVLPAIPAAPTDQDVTRARDLLLNELLVDFPFDGPPSRAHAVAMLLLPFVRPMIDGPTPLHLVDAPQAGTGKSLLVEACGMIAGETAPSVMTEKSGWGNGPDEAEWRKAITSALLGGKRIIRIDNVRCGLDSAQLSAALTCTVWEDRLLGHSRQVSVPVNCMWIATGNNVSLTTEVSRRTVPTRLDARVDRPWERQEFRHRLPGWAIQNRADLVWACLTLIQAWVAARRPNDPAVDVLGSYQAWTETIGGILRVAGVPGFLGNLRRMYEIADTEGAMWRQFIEGAWWPNYSGAEVATRDLRTLAADTDMLGTVLGQGNEHSQTTKLGKALGKLQDRVFGGYRVEAGEKDHSGRATWRLVAIGAHVPPEGPDGDRPHDALARAVDRRGADNLCATSAPIPEGRSACGDGVSAESAEVAEVAEVLRGSAAVEEISPTDGRRAVIDGEIAIGQPDTGRVGKFAGALAGEHTSAPPQNDANARSDANGGPAEVPQRLTTSAPTSAGDDFADLNEVRL